MNLNHFVAVKSAEGKATVMTTRADRRIAVIGASFPVSVSWRVCQTRGRLGLDSLTLMLPEGEDGLLALCAADTNVDKKGVSHEIRQTFLVPVKWNSETSEAIVDLKEPFIPSREAVPQCFYSGHMNLVCGGLTFTTDPRSSGNFLVGDPDLLCQAALGKVSVEKLREVAQEIRREESELQQYEKIIRMLFNAADKMGRFSHLEDFEFLNTPNDQALEILDPEDFFDLIVGQDRDLEGARTKIMELEANTAWSKDLSPTLKSKLVIEALWNLYCDLRVHQESDWLDRWKAKTWSQVLKSLESARTEVQFKQDKQS